MARNLSLDIEEVLGPAPQLTYAATVRSSILAIMAVLSVIGNSWTIYNIRRSRVAQKLFRQNCTAIYTLTAHLSGADLLVSAFCMIGDSVWLLTVQWLAGDFMCKVVKFLQMFSLYLSTYILVLIGLDRLMAVKYPMRIINMGRRTKTSLIGVYVMSGLLSLPQVVIFRVESGPFISEFKQCVTHGFYTEPWQEQFYTALTLLWMFLIPLAILIGTYLLTFRSISYSERRLFPVEEPPAPPMAKGPQGTIEQVGILMKTSYANRQKLLQRAKYTSLKMSVIIILAFIVCWLPYNIMMITFIFTNVDEQTEETFRSVIFFFGMSNSLINPLIYGLFHLMPKRKKFLSSFQSSQTNRTGMAVGEVSHNLITSNKKLISRIG